MNGGYAFLSDLPGGSGDLNTLGASRVENANQGSGFSFFGSVKPTDTQKHANSTFSEELGIIIIGALIFIISFMWKDFITDFQHYFLSDNPSILARFIYTLLVSVFVVHIIVLIRNYLNLSRHSFFPSLYDVPDQKEVDP